MCVGDHGGGHDAGRRRVLAGAAALTIGGMPPPATAQDPAAVTASHENAVANEVELTLGLPELANGMYNTVLANILASPLKVLAPLLCGHVASGGRLVLAGILERQTEELKAAYAPYVKLEVADTMDGWVLMVA